MSKQTDLINIPDAITVDGSNVGIGTSTPPALLSIFGAGTNSPTSSNAQQSYDNALFRIHNFANSSVGLSIGSAGGNSTYIQTSYNEGTTSPLALNPFGGKVGIGTSSPSATLTASQSSNNIFALERTGISGSSGQFGINIENNSQTTVSYDDGAQLVFGTASSPSTHVGFTERMRIDSSGRVTMPYQPAFWAFSSTFATTGNYPFTNFSISGAGKFNTGNHLNLTSGVFTAPLAGKYQFNGAFHSSSSSTTARRIGRFELNGNSLGEFAESSAQYADIGASIIVNMSANDTMKLITHPLNFTEADFSGFLIG
ncbi:hypothetical protein N9I05_01660 [Pseudomonadales bacterium]|nr:hypothetical protein [Pseudomonadales bacterium]